MHMNERMIESRRTNLCAASFEDAAEFKIAAVYAEFLLMLRLMLVVVMEEGLLVL